MTLILRSNTFFDMGESFGLIVSICFLHPGPIPVHVFPLPDS